MNDKDLNILDQLVLLALDDEKGVFVSDATVFSYCLAGAAIFELVKRERISIQNEKAKVINSEKLNDEVLDYCLNLILESKKEKQVKTWIEALGNKVNTLKNLVLTKLISKGILEKKEGKILWIFSNNKYPMKNGIIENNIRQKLYNIVVNKTKATEEEIMILSLVDTCSLTKEVFGSEIAKEYKKGIKQIIKESQLVNETGKLVTEVYETIMAVLVIIIASTTVTTVT